MKVFRFAGGLSGRLRLAGFLICLVSASVSAPFARGEDVKDLPKPTDYVSDFAHVLSPQAISELDTICSQLDHTKANAQLAIVTVHNLNGDDAASFADDLETKWKMGKKGSDRGALLLLAVDDHKYRIEVGYGLEGILNDAKIGDIGRAMVPYLRARQYDGAVMLAVGQLAQVIASDSGVTLEQQAQPPPVRRHEQSGFPWPIIFWLIIFLFFGGFSLLRFLLFMGLFGNRWRGGPWMGSGWGGGGWGGGGFGGGGGGGNSGGGGFGGFGGGSFGGGGAGGDW
ncbi:MAG TPA: TPM domain-containing protein [Terracidiphilus sp.]|nr:TPM domain-containing protein [Terracidiphilus sp.]